MAEEKEPRCEVWTTGLFGVNVVDSPLHLVDGEYLAAQNAEPFTEEGEGGIRKRLGIAAFTGSAIGTAIAAITSIPLVDPLVIFARLVALDRDAGTARQSTNGTAWSTLNGLSAVSSWNAGARGTTQSLPSIDGSIYYPAAACTAMERFNGVGIASVTPLPQTVTVAGDLYAVTSVVGAVVRSGAIWWLVNYTGPSLIYVVWKFDASDESYAQVAIPFIAGGGTGFGTGVPTAIEVYQDNVYIQASTASDNACRVYRCDPATETAWTLEDTQIDAGSIFDGCGLCADDSSTIYAGTGGQAGAASKVLRKRTAAGVWATVIDAGIADAQVAPVFVSGDRVLAWVSDGTNLRLRESLDAGGSFSTVFTEATPRPTNAQGAYPRLVRLGSAEFLQYGDATGGENVARTIRNSSGWASVDTYGTTYETAGLLSGVSL